MNIILDGHFLDKKKEGSRTFIYSYLEGLLRLGSSEPQLLNSFSFLVPVFQPDYWGKHFAKLENVRFIKTSRNAILRNHIDLPFKVLGFSGAVLQSIYYLPFFLPKAVKKIVLIHDVLPFTHPHYFSRYFRCKFKKMVRLAQRQADCVVCGSEYSKAAIQNVFNIETKRIRMIPYGIHLDRFTAGWSAAGPDEFRSAFPTAPYILVVGRLDPRKGLRIVLDLFMRLLRRMDLRLVLVGGSEALPAAEMRVIASLQAAKRLQWLQNVSDEELAHLYRGARLMLFLPAIEGFGLPVIEAMAAGIPYLTIPQGGLKEIAIAESWVDAGDMAAMEQRALQLLHDNEMRQSFTQKGYTQVQKFRCEDMVKSYLQLYREC